MPILKEKNDMEKEFHCSVDGYLKFCEEGKEPNQELLQRTD